MNLRKRIVLLLLPILAACASMEGTYAPACVAFAGNTVELSDGKFTWSKFTDAVEVNAAGDVVDPFPGFPVRGTYVIENDVVHLSTNVGELMAEMHLVRNAGQVHLLTATEFEAWQDEGKIPDCALTLGAADRK